MADTNPTTAPATPKRKRPGQGSFTSPLHTAVLETGSSSLNLRKLTDMDERRGSESPRTAITTKFKDLGLVSVPTMDVSATSSKQEAVIDEDSEMFMDEDISARKRLKTSDNSKQRQPIHCRHATIKRRHDSPVDEAPSMQSENLSQQSVMEIKPLSSLSEVRPESPTSSPSGRLRRGRSPPPPVPSSVTDLGADSKSRSSLQGQQNGADPFVWQDWEITGHLALDADDDGYGINGIGFRPTPQTAEARLQRRKKQIADWKSREAREQRQKRSERRYGSSKNEQPQQVARRVSFAA